VVKYTKKHGSKFTSTSDKKAFYDEELMQYMPKHFFDNIRRKENTLAISANNSSCSFLKDMDKQQFLLKYFTPCVRILIEARHYS
jgi:hypothetical protein